jgi:2-oxoglutarate dehydrogenase E2 component (dihydrolipoamide succinyltransferase)
MVASSVIVNVRRATVLGMHAIKDKPIVVNVQIVVRLNMVTTLTYGHWLMDGRTSFG